MCSRENGWSQRSRARSTREARHQMHRTNRSPLQRVMKFSIRVASSTRNAWARLSTSPIVSSLDPGLEDSRLDLGDQLADIAFRTSDEIRELAHGQAVDVILVEARPLLRTRIVQNLGHNAELLIDDPEFLGGAGRRAWMASKNRTGDASKKGSRRSFVRQRLTVQRCSQPRRLSISPPSSSVRRSCTNTSCVVCQRAVRRSSPPATKRHRSGPVVITSRRGASSRHAAIRRTLRSWPRSFDRSRANTRARSARGGRRASRDGGV